MVVGRHVVQFFFWFSWCSFCNADWTTPFLRPPFSKKTSSLKDKHPRTLTTPSARRWFGTSVRAGHACWLGRARHLELLLQGAAELVERVRPLVDGSERKKHQGVKDAMQIQTKAVVV